MKDVKRVGKNVEAGSERMGWTWVFQIVRIFSVDFCTHRREALVGNRGGKSLMFLRGGKDSQKGYEDQMGV